MDEIERIARLICQALHAGIKPDDTLVGSKTPLWRLYEPAAHAIVADRERMEERITYTDGKEDAF